MKERLLTSVAKGISLIIKIILFYVFFLGVVKLFYLIDDIFYLVENIENTVWNLITNYLGIGFAVLIFLILLAAYLLLPPYKIGIKQKIFDLFQLVFATLKSLSKILSGFYYLYDIEYLIELFEGKRKNKDQTNNTHVNPTGTGKELNKDSS